MQLASSLYKGGELFAAAGSDYTTARELGLICPFCKESVFLVKNHMRGSSPIPAAWRHYKMSTTSTYCEQRALSREGKETLKQLQPQAHNQRLKLFNRRFWEIFKHGKVIPRNLRETCLMFMDEPILERMVRHCWEQWDVEAILRALPGKIKYRLQNPETAEALRNHPALQRVDSETADKAVEDFVNSTYSVLRLKILSEVIAWLGTRMALPAFEKLIELSLIDCLEVLPTPVHSQSVAEMALISLTLTDWEKAIASLDSTTKAIGFG